MELAHYHLFHIQLARVSHNGSQIKDVGEQKHHPLMGRTAKSPCYRYGYRESINDGHQLWIRYIAMLLLTVLSPIFGGH